MQLQQSIDYGNQLFDNIRGRIVSREFLEKRGVDFGRFCVAPAIWLKLLIGKK